MTPSDFPCHFYIDGNFEFVYYGDPFVMLQNVRGLMEFVKFDLSATEWLSMYLWKMITIIS